MQTIQITVVERLSGDEGNVQPVIGAIVYRKLKSTGDEVPVGATNGSGRALVLAAPGDEVAVKYTGFKEERQTVSEGTTGLSFTMRPDPVNVPGVTVYAKNKRWYERWELWLAIVVLAVLAFLIWKKKI